MSDKLRQALEKIAAIEDKMYGDDWQEIEEARSIARAALAEPAECCDNDSPWLVCKMCVSAGRCAMAGCGRLSEIDDGGTTCTKT